MNLGENDVGYLPPILKVDVLPVAQVGGQELDLLRGNAFSVQRGDLLDQPLAAGVQLLDLPVGVGHQNRAGPRQGVQQLLDLVLHLGQLNVSGGQLGVACLGPGGRGFEM